MGSDYLTTRRAVVAVLVLLLATGVLVGVLFDDGPAEESELGANATERLTALDGIEATVTTVVTRGNRTNRTVWQMKRRPVRTVECWQWSAGVSGPDEIVSNGTYRWAYNSSNNTVRRTSAAELQAVQTSRGERIEQLFRQATAGDGSTETTPTATVSGIAPLPAVPDPHQPAATAPGDRDTTDAQMVTYDGTDTVDGREVHVLHVRSQNESSQGQYANVSQTLWIDAEWFAPLKYRTAWRENGQQVTATVRYSNVSFNPGFAAGTFQFTVPDDAALVSPTVGLNATERIAAIDSISATTTTRIAGLGGTDSTASRDSAYRQRQRITIQPGTGKRRAEVLNTSGPYSTVGSDLFVSNGTVTWIYDREENNVTVLESEFESNIQQQGARIERLFARLNRTRRSPDTATNALPKPSVIPAAGTAGAGGFAPQSVATNGSASRYGVHLDGVEQVDDRTTYVLSVTPVESDAASSRFTNYSRTIWIDEETFFPLKRQIEFVSDGDQFTSVTTYTNITINPELNASRFEFDPPSNATIIKQELSLGERYDSRSGVAANATVPVPDPSLPSDFTFGSGRTSRTEFADSVTLRYTNETSRLTVSVYDFNETRSNGSDNTSGQPVQLGTHNGTFSQSGPYRSVSWSCDGIEYSVSGSAISKARLVDIAKSIACR